LTSNDGSLKFYNEKVKNKHPVFDDFSIFISKFCIKFKRKAEIFNSKIFYRFPFLNKFIL